MLASLELVDSSVPCHARTFAQNYTPAAPDARDRADARADAHAVAHAVSHVAVHADAHAVHSVAHADAHDAHGFRRSSLMKTLFQLVSLHSSL